MSCDNLGDITPCGIEKNPMHNIKNAGINVGIDLEKPIDCSQMDIYLISSVIDNSNYLGNIQVQRTTVLHAYIFNDKGEQEELTITFELLSQRMPKFDLNKQTV